MKIHRLRCPRLYVAKAKGVLASSLQELESQKRPVHRYLAILSRVYILQKTEFAVYAKAGRVFSFGRSFVDQF